MAEDGEGLKMKGTGGDAWEEEDSVVYLSRHSNNDVRRFFSVNDDIVNFATCFTSPNRLFFASSSSSF